MPCQHLAFQSACWLKYLVIICLGLNQPLERRASSAPWQEQPSLSNSSTAMYDPPLIWGSSLTPLLLLQGQLSPCSTRARILNPVQSCTACASPGWKVVHSVPPLGK